MILVNDSNSYPFCETENLQSKDKDSVVSNLILL